MSPFSLEELDRTLEQVRRRADQVDLRGEWPADDLRDLNAIGAMKWMVPGEFGGDGVEPLPLHVRYQSTASASIAVALILTQRDSAVNIINSAPDWPMREQTLRRLAGEGYTTTVGIAQLTTSRQRGAPPIVATRVSNGYVINGQIPWCTGAGHAEFIIGGAFLEDRRQLLFVLPMDLPGVMPSEPLPLVALRSTHTVTVNCRDVRLDESLVLNGPVEQALAMRPRGVPIGQAFLALGLCDAALRLMQGIDSDPARRTIEQLKPQLADLEEEVYAHCQPDAPDDAGRGNALRGRSIELALRTTHAAVSLYKGTALLAGHPAQRLAREAMFLLVWSCPAPVVECTLDLLAQPSRGSSQ